MGLPIWREPQPNATAPATASDPTAHTRSSIRRRPRENHRDGRRPFFHGVLSGPRGGGQNPRFEGFNEGLRRLADRGTHVRLLEQEMDRLARVNAARGESSESSGHNRQSMVDFLSARNRSGELPIEHESVPTAYGDNISDLLDILIPSSATLLPNPAGASVSDSDHQRTSSRAIYNRRPSRQSSGDNLLLSRATPPFSAAATRGTDPSDGHAPSSENARSRRPISRHGLSWWQSDRLAAASANNHRSGYHGGRIPAPNMLGHVPSTARPVPSRREEIWGREHRRAVPAPPAPAPEFGGLGDRERSWSPESDDDLWETLFTTITPDPTLPSAGSSFASNAATANDAAVSPGRSHHDDNNNNNGTIAPRSLRVGRNSTVVDESLISPLPTPPPHGSPECEDDDEDDDAENTPRADVLSNTVAASARDAVRTGRTSPDSLYIDAVEVGLRTRQLARSVSELAHRYQGFARAYSSGGLRPGLVRDALDVMSGMVDSIRDSEDISAAWWAEAGITRGPDGSLRRRSSSSSGSAMVVNLPALSSHAGTATTAAAAAAPQEFE